MVVAGGSGKRGYDDATASGVGSCIAGGCRRSSSARSYPVVAGKGHERRVQGRCSKSREEKSI